MVTACIHFLHVCVVCGLLIQSKCSVPSACSPRFRDVFQVGGLASENVRWAEAVGNFRLQGRTLCGDVLLITAFVSYLGYFTKRYRLQLMDGTWKPYLSQLQVSLCPAQTSRSAQRIAPSPENSS